MLKNIYAWLFIIQIISMIIFGGTLKIGKTFKVRLGKDIIDIDTDRKENEELIKENEILQNEEKQGIS